MAEQHDRRFVDVKGRMNEWHATEGAGTMTTTESGSVATLPHERLTDDTSYEGFREHIPESCRYQGRDVTDWLSLEDYYRDLPIEEDFYGAVSALRQAAGNADKTRAAMVQLLNAAQARERQFVQQATLRAFDAGYAYAIEAITGRPPAA
jgi:hypothetical protein